MSTGKVVLIAFVAFILGRCSVASTDSESPATSRSTEAVSAPTQVAPAHHLKVVSFNCDPNHGRPRADLTVQNVGTTTLEYSKVFFSFGGAVDSYYLDPTSLKPGSLATSTAYAPKNKGAVDCSVLSIQDKEGNPVTLEQ